MSLDADHIVDRRRLRRKLSFWRVVAFLIAILAVGAGFFLLSGVSGPSKRSAHVARLDINGVIVDDRDRLKLIREIGESDNVKGVIVAINSPGGSTTGGEALYEALRELAQKKPTVATIGTLGASAGYMTAIAADHIVTRFNSLTGSIGVYIQFGNFKGLLDTLGVEFETVKSGPLKAEPNFYSPAPQETKNNLQGVVDDSYNWFVGLVSERRKMPEDKVRELANGGIYSGKRAMELGLADAIGGEATALKWLEVERKVGHDLPIVSWRVEKEDGAFSFLSQMTAIIGAGLAQGFAKGVSDQLTSQTASSGNGAGGGVSLDGLVSVWQAPDATGGVYKTDGGE